MNDLPETRPEACTDASPIITGVQTCGYEKNSPIPAVITLRTAPGSASWYVPVTRSPETLQGPKAYMLSRAISEFHTNMYVGGDGIIAMPENMQCER